MTVCLLATVLTWFERRCFRSFYSPFFPPLPCYIPNLSSSFISSSSLSVQKRCTLAGVEVMKTSQDKEDDGGRERMRENERE